MLLKAKNDGVPKLRVSRIHALRREYENLTMEEEEQVLDYYNKLSQIMVELKSLGEKLTDVDVITKLLRSVSGKFNSITTYLEQFQDLNSTSVEEILETLKIHEDKLKDRLAKKEEKALLSRALNKDKSKESKTSISRGRGKGRGRGRGHGRGRGKSSSKVQDSDDDEKPRDKSIVTCYDCQRKGHYLNECRQPKKERPKNDNEKSNLTKE